MSFRIEAVLEAGLLVGAAENAPKYPNISTHSPIPMFIVCIPPIERPAIALCALASDRSYSSL